MLEKLEVTTAQGELLTLEILEIASGYSVEDIDGLDPVKATIVSSRFARLDRSQFQSSRRDSRNIILKLGFHPDYEATSVQSLRSNLYRYFMPKSVLGLRFFEDSGLVVDIEGRVESMDAPRFTKDPDATISILCLDSDFVGTTAETISASTTSTTTEIEEEYTGTIEVGFKLTMNVNRSISSFTLNHKPADNTLRQLEFSYPLLAGDVLEISTVPGSKGAWLTRSGIRSSILYAVSEQSEWVQLFPGLNKLRVFASGAPIPYTIEYTPHYGGL